MYVLRTYLGEPSVFIEPSDANHRSVVRWVHQRSPSRARVARAGSNCNTGGRKLFGLGVKVNENRINLLVTMTQKS